MGESPWNHLDRVGAHSQGRLHLLRGEQDDGQDWPATLNQRDHPLKNPHKGMGGQSPWPEENPYAFAKTIPHMLLLIVWKGYDPSHGLPARATYRWCFGMPQCLCQHGAKVILSLVSKAGRNTKTIAIHLREIHYRMVNICNICRSFAGMNAQSILDHCSGCKAKHCKECAEHEGHEKVKKLHKKKSRSQGQKEAS